MPSDSPSRIIAIVGTTASGKSELALQVAQELGTEIINADAMQLYRGLDIGTAKLPMAERRGLVHHQIDVLDIHDEASVATYQKHARADLADILARRGCAVIVGGSGLYLRALLDRISFPGTDPDIRNRWQRELERQGAAGLHRQLATKDPAAAAKIEPTNTRRLVRALEVIELTGRPFSANLPDYRYEQDAVQLGLDHENDVLDERIQRRAADMFATGLIEETSRLLDRGLADCRTAARAVGYPQARAVIEEQMTEPEAIEATALATRQLARRQRKWFRRDHRIHWLDPTMDLLAQTRTLVA